MRTREGVENYISQVEIALDRARIDLRAVIDGVRTGLMHGILPRASPLCSGMVIAKARSVGATNSLQQRYWIRRSVGSMSSQARLPRAGGAVSDCDLRRFRMQLTLVQGRVVMATVQREKMARASRGRGRIDWRMRLRPYPTLILRRGDLERSEVDVTRRYLKTSGARRGARAHGITV